MATYNTFANTLRTPSKKRYAAVFIALFSLLFQVETVFACNMMGQVGSLKHCCCGDKVSAEKDIATKTHPCCKVSEQLSIKHNSSDHDESSVSQNNYSPDFALTFVLVSWLDDFKDVEKTAIHAEWALYPASPGTDTYLSTLRLRI